MSTETLKHQIDRTGWPSGPWDEEPDRIDFEHAGFACLILRNDMGNLCGYVGVGPDHPFYGKDYEEIDADVHGGLTYCGTCRPPICHVPKPGMTDDVFWFGFDCGHFRDLVPSMMKYGSIESHIYRDVSYVKSEINNFADFLRREQSSSPPGRMDGPEAQHTAE